MAFGADRSVKVNLTASVTGYVAGITAAKRATTDFAKDAGTSAKKNKADWDAVGKTVAGAGIAVALGLGVAVAKFTDFDAAMSAAAAATDVTGAALDGLRALAIKAGKDTQFSATEAAQGITEMGKAGVSAKDIMGGGLLGALDLAAAGQIDVARAGEIAATAMTQFGLEGSQIPHVADLLAAAAGKAQGGVEDMANALKYAGPVANSMGVSIEETTGVLALFASQGIIGEQAGTSFRSMLLSLTAPSKIAAKAMEELGINVYDAQGNFIGMQGAAQELQNKLGPLDQATRNSALGQIFGNESIGAAIKLYEGGGAAVKKWTAAVDDAGFAQEQAAKLTDNLKGDIERLGGSIDTVLIQGGSSANTSLRGLAQGLESAVNGLGSLGPTGTAAAVGLLAASSAIAIVGGGALIAVPRIVAFKASLEVLGVTAGRTGAALKIAGSAFAVFAAGAAASALQSYIGQSKVASTETSKLAKSMIDMANGAKAAGEFGKLLSFEGGAIFGLGAEDIRSTSEALDKFAVSAKIALAPDFATRLNSLTDGGASLAIFEKRVTQVDAALANMVQSGNTAAATKIMDELTTRARAQGVPMDELAKKFPQYGQAVAAAGVASTGTKPSVDALTGSVQGQELSAEDAKKAFDDLVLAVQNYGSKTLEARGSAREFEAAIDAATASVKENGRTLNIGTEKGRANAAALDAIATSALAAATANFKNGTSVGAVSSQMVTARGRFVSMAISMGMSKASANALANQLGLTTENVKNLGGAANALPAAKATKITAPGAVQSRTEVHGLRGEIDALRNKTVTISTILSKTTINSIITKNATDPRIPGYAAGTVFHPGGLAVVGETGPELVSLPRGSQVIPEQQVRFDKLSGMRFASGAFTSQASTAASTQATLAVYVQNPFTGEYLLAKVATVADDRASAAVTAQSRRILQGTRF